MLYVVVNVYMELVGVVIEIINYDFRVGVVIVFDVIDVKFVFQYCGYIIDGDDCCC